MNLGRTPKEDYSRCQLSQCVTNTLLGLLVVCFNSTIHFPSDAC